MAKGKSSYILGVYTGHTATAALLKDGKIIACVSEERFNGVKNYLGFPKEAIRWCLKFADISGQELDAVILCGLYGAPIHVSDRSDRSISVLSFVYSIAGIGRQIWRTVSYYLPPLRPIGRWAYRLMTRTVGSYSKKRDRQFVANFLNIPLTKIRQYEHHLIHAAAGYYASPFNRQKALVLTLDAEGDWLCATVNVFESDSWRRLAETSREHSLGWLYLYLTKYLGMKPMEHEYKVMGLAPYAKEKHVQTLFDVIKDIITLDPANPLRFRSKFNTYDSLRYLRQKMAPYRFDNIAGAFQRLLEERMSQWVGSALATTKLKTLVVAGGAFMNVKANQRILAENKLTKAYFLPSGGDESLPIGACYLGYIALAHERGQAPEPQSIEDLYLGPSYSDEEIGSYLHRHGYDKKYRLARPRSIEQAIAKLLADGKVVARLAGRMEFGARALGNRSILAHPQDPATVMIINEQMKDRDFWMPFAPSILEERMADYCQITKGIVSPYMMISYETTSLGRKELKAAMHPYDMTVRAQVVKQSWNESYYQVIKSFEKLTGIGAVLNTSFNLHGLPIVMGPKEALYAFEHSGLEHLAMEGYLLQKNKA